MYIEETGTGDGDIKITVEGEEYTAEANYDLDNDGIDETVAVMTDQGFAAYIDEDADGVADLMQTVNPDGEVVNQARYAESSGEWIAERPDQHPHGEHPNDQADGRSMVVDTPEGDKQVGPATEDSNNDGKADTAIVQTDNGTTLVTDVDGDGAADQMVELDDSGGVTISHHTGEGEWTVVEEGRIDQQGQYTVDPNAGATDDATWNLDHQPTAREQGQTQQGQTQQDGAQEGAQGGGAKRSGASSGREAGPDSDSLWSD